MIRVADYIAQSLAAHGIADVFLVTGGGAMHLNDAIGRCHELRYVACHHEQACTMAAQSYYRLTNRLAAVNVTAGPGGTNAITGVFGAWTDSLGMVVISGQVKWETLVRSTGLPLRQLGDQEVDITRLVAPITKYAVMITDPATVRYHVERAIHLARTGRPGPTWLDVPMNVQSAMVDPATLTGYDPAEDSDPALGATLDTDCRTLLERLDAAERPVIYAGAGVRLAGAERALVTFAERLGIPVVTGFNAHDLLASDHPLFAGRPGTIGDRPGNFATQNADVVVVIGCRLNIRQISYAWENFARNGYVAMVDVDRAELEKPTVDPDLPIHADAAAFLDAMHALLDARGDESGTGLDRSAWIARCQAWRARYPVVLPEYWQGEQGVNPYCFGAALFDALDRDDIVVTGDGTACITTFQSAELQAGQRLYSDSGCAPMGFDLPAAIGACVAADGQRVVCIAGDGSLMMNVQELQTIRGYDLPVKLFILNNAGYASIRMTQRAFFPDNPVGAGPESGVTFPDFAKLVPGFDLPFVRCASHDDLRSAIERTLATPGPAVCEIMLDVAQGFSPRVSSKRLEDGTMVTAPLEDMAPFLSREELAENMTAVPLEHEPR
jgi:acetolactate synthase-1/2/3 large subunit